MRIMLCILSSLLFTPLGFAEYKNGPFPTSLDEVLAIDSTVRGVEDCETQFAENESYCIQRSWNQKDIFIEVYMLLDKGHLDGKFSTSEAVKSQYFDFEAWPQYTASSEIGNVISYPYSQSIDGGMLPNGDYSVIHSHHYVSKAPWPVSAFTIKGTATHSLLKSPHPGAVVSIVSQNTRDWQAPWKLIHPLPDGNHGGVGIIGQDANIQIVDLEDEDAWLIVYRTRIRLKLSVLISLAAKDTSRTIETILTGMFLTPPRT